MPTLIDTTSHVLEIALWQSRLGLGRYEAAVQQIHPMQVTGEDGLPGAELVGVIIEESLFTIVHTRPLQTDDIVHELLHVLCPQWNHAEVEEWTDRLVQDPSLAGALAAKVSFPTQREHHEKEKDEMPAEYKAFNLRTRKECTILNPEIVTMKNGRKAVQGTASDDGKTKVFRIMSAKEIEGAAK
jgi:hypothetical protein